MKKTKDSILQKRDKKKKEIEIKERTKMMAKQRELMNRTQKEYEYQLEKAERKSKSFLNKKFLEYDRKCKNEIRKLEGKEERVYKKKEPKFSEIQFCLELLQENSKLRDTDREGKGFCISCNQLKTWGELAGGHRYSRSIRNICLLPENVNAQCHKCNRTTGPRGDIVAKEQTNKIYDENLDIKYGKGTSTRLRELKEAYFQNTNGTTYGNSIENMIKENELRWKGKDFYKPKKKWREIAMKQGLI